MRNFYVIFSIIVFSVLIASCNKEKLKSPKASFIYIANPELIIADASIQGSNDHHITDTWVYVNDQYTGAYPLGSVIPVVSTGNTNVKLYAGIKNNGISSTRLSYEFYNAFEINQGFELGKTYTVSPKYTYQTGCKFHLIENFEQTGLRFQALGDSAFTRTGNGDPNAYGGTGKSAFMGMSAAKPTAIMKTSTSIIDFPSSATANVYLEMEYKCNQKFSISMMCGNVEERNVITVNPSADWNKIYIQLANSIYSPTAYNSYDLIIKAIKESDVANPAIYIDNVKIISL